MDCGVLSNDDVVTTYKITQCYTPENHILNMAFALIPLSENYEE